MRETISYKLGDVFNESRVPTVTFVEPKEFADLVTSLETDGKHVTICGPSGCGKTTLVAKALESAGFSDGSRHEISGRDYHDVNSLERLLELEFGADPHDEANQVAWMQTAGLIVIDDFHHLSLEVQRQIAYKLKRWAEQGIRCVMVGIADSAHQLLETDPELGIRNDPFNMKSQDTNFIRQLIERGESALNFSFAEDTKEDFVAASKGVPSAAHVICRAACSRVGVKETLVESHEFAVKIEDIRDAVIRSYEGKYQQKIVGLAQGKRRAKSVHNTYFQIVKALCLLEKSEITIDELRDRIVAPEPDAQERNRKNTSFHNCLKYLPSVIEERGLQGSIYYNATTSKSISIEDPSFRFYLSLVDVDALGRLVTVRPHSLPYDVAISFAGEDREAAQALRDALADRGIEVFYDFDQQAQLWGQNLRAKLADVYAHEAQFMIALLSERYPEKDWPAFELEVAKEAKDDRGPGYILPLRLDDVNIVGLPKDLGHLDLREMDTDKVADIFEEKICLKTHA